MNQNEHIHDGKRFRVMNPSYFANGFAVEGEVYEFNLSAFKEALERELACFNIDYDAGEICYYDSHSDTWWYVMPENVEFIDGE